MLLTLLPTSAKFNSGPRKIKKKKATARLLLAYSPPPPPHPCQPQMNKKGKERQRHRNRVRHVNHSLIHSFIDDWLIYHRFAKKYGSESIAGGWILRQFFFFFAESKIIKNLADRYCTGITGATVLYGTWKINLKASEMENRSIIIIIIGVNHGNNQ